MGRVSVYVVAHKPLNIEKYKLDPCYKIIRVGEYSKENSNEISDNTGDNISMKNANYCELTAAYWIWKNDNVSDIVGLCHYRRFLTRHPLSLKSKYFLRGDDIADILSRYDAIAPEKIYHNNGVYQTYFESKKGFEKDLRTAHDAIKALHPDYIPFFQSEIIDACGAYYGNMIVMKKPLYDEYCHWLFDILTYVENRTDISDYSKEQARIFGYLSERLLNVWIAKNNLRVKEFRMINTEQQTSARYYLAETLKSMGILQLIRSGIFKFHKRKDASAVGKSG